MKVAIYERWNGMKRPAFITTRLEEKKKEDKGKVFTIRLNEEQIKQLEWCQKVLSQPKDSTAYKQVFEFGLFVLQQDLTGRVLTTVFKNKQRNWRTGVVDPEDL